MATHEQVRELYASASDDDVRDALTAGEASYTADAWSIITAEATRRGLDIRVPVESATPDSPLITLDDGLQADMLGPAAAEGRKQVQAIVVVTVFLAAAATLHAMFFLGSPAEIGAAEAVRAIVNFGLIAVVSIKLAQGREWARWIAAVLLGYVAFNGLSTVFAMRNAIPREALVLASTSIAFGTMAFVLVVSPGIHAYFRALAAAREAHPGQSG